MSFLHMDNTTGVGAKCLIFMVLSMACMKIVFSVTCESPRDPEDCILILVSCAGFTNESCTASGGQYVGRSGACDYCDMCGKYVGAGQRCNVSEEGSSQDAGIVYVTKLCSAPFVCSRQQNGECVRPEECKFVTA